jgi:hypothetical protein
VLKDKIPYKSFESPKVKFICKLEAEKQKETKPWPKVPRNLKVSAYFGEPGKKGIDSADLPITGLGYIDGWVTKITSKENEELFSVIADGTVPIYLEGNVSKSGSKTHNDKLVKKRIETVKRKLTRSLGSKVKFVTFPKGQSKFEGEDEYRVDIYFDIPMAETAIYDRRTKNQK